MTTPLRALYQHEGALYCETCAQKLKAASGQELQIESALDPTVCVQCGADNGSAEFPPVAGFPYCLTCTAFLYNRSLPGWLKVSLAGLLVLLAYALAEGSQYFRTGRNLVLGERLLEEKRPEEAAARLEEVVQKAPNCEKCVLLLAKAYFLSGQFPAAWAALEKHDGGRFQAGDLFNDVNKIAERVGKALEKAEESRKVAAEEKWEEAIPLAREAVRLYSEAPSIGILVWQLEGAEAFERKDYDTFLEKAERVWQHQPGSTTSAAQVASALACKYAVTEDTAYRTRSEETLAKAEGLATSEEDRTSFQEYAERIRHRLATRQIIDKDEYDRRFRRRQTAGKE